jgi:long-chain acyl-CoA synthetase
MKAAPITRLFDIPQKQLNKFPLQDALVGKENRVWKKYSTDDFINIGNLFSYGLLAMGLKKGDTIGMISNNRPEWNMADIGMLQTGAVNVPIYPTLSENEFAFILNDCEAKYVLVSDATLYQKIMNIKSKVSSLIDVFTFDKIDGVKNWKEITQLGEKNKQEEKLEQIKKEIQPYDLATLIYTSGTTGNPKGVMLSHNNLVSNILAVEDLPPVSHGARAMSFLPLCHIYERVLTYVYIYLGISIYYAESMEKISDNLKELKPDVFSTVPRLLEKVFDKIVAKGKELTGIKKKLFFWALDLGLKYELHGANGWWYETQLSLANKIIFSKWREALGGNVKAIVSGGAALQPRLARVFWSAKIVVLEGYGLTETSPVITINNTMKKNAVKFGTVGPVIPQVEVKIAEDGEILCKGPNVMLGYYHRPDLTAEVIDKDGYFHTGDIGVFEENRFLKITDRKKEIFKTSGGKYIAPQPLENKFKESQFIEQLMVIGENRKFPAALIVPAFAHLKSWCEIKGITYSSNEEMIKNVEVLSRIQKEVEGLNKDFAQYEQIKKFALVGKEWTVDSGDLTPTLKLKRKIILQKNLSLIEKIYSES